MDEHGLACNVSGHSEAPLFRGLRRSVTRKVTMEIMQGCPLPLSGTAPGLPLLGRRRAYGEDPFAGTLPEG